MAKLRKVDTFIHEKSGIEVDCFANGTIFECTVLEERMTSPEASMLRHKVFDKLEHWMQMEWHPIIEVSCMGPSSGRWSEPTEGKAGITLSIERYWLSRSPAGRVMKVDWETDEEHRKAKMRKMDQSDLQLTKLPLKAPFRKSDRYENEWLLNYDESLWATLEKMLFSIQEMQTGLARLFKSREGILKLQSTGVKLLGAGK